MSEPLVCVVSLTDAIRQGNLLDSLKAMGLNATLIEAVDGRALSRAEVLSTADPLAAKLLYGQELTATQLGCVLSHRRAYEALLASGAEWALILEDDAYPDEKLKDALHWTAQRRWAHPTVIELYSGGRISASSTVASGEGGLTYQKLKTFPGSTVAYLINRAAAQRARAHDGLVASRADWPAWATEVEFWRVIPNVVEHGAPGLNIASTMLPPRHTESKLAKTIRWWGLATGVSYLRLRKHYPGGARQYYQHAVKPTATFWSTRWRKRGR